MHDLARFVLGMARSTADGLMDDRCRVERPGEPTLDKATSRVEPQSTVVYEGPCAIAGDRPHESTQESAMATAVVQRIIIKLPAFAGPFTAGDVLEVTASQHQPLLVGNRYRIAGVDVRTHQSSQRMYGDLIA